MRRATFWLSPLLFWGMLLLAGPLSSLYAQSGADRDERHRRQQQQQDVRNFRQRDRTAGDRGGLPESSENPNRPTVSLSVSPQNAYPGDTLTIDWSVTSADVATPWADAVHLNCSFATLPRMVRENADSAGSVEIVVPRDARDGTITLTTGEALYAARETVQVTIVAAPVLEHLLVQRAGRGEFRASGHALAGDRIRFQGSNFGAKQGASRACLMLDGETIELPVVSWSDLRVVARIPDSTPIQRGNVLIAKGASPKAKAGGKSSAGAQGNRFGGNGDVRQSLRPSADLPGRARSNELALQIWGRDAFTSDNLRAFADNTLDIGATIIHLDRGEDGCEVDFNDVFNALGVDDLQFTIPSRRLAREGVAVRVYLNDIESRNDDPESDPEIAIVDGQFVLGVLFESHGDELVVEGVGALPDGLAPNVQLDHMRVNLCFTPTVVDGRLAVSEVSVRFDADIQVGADWLNELIELSALEDLVRDMVQDELLEQVNTPEVRSGLAAAISRYLSDGRLLGEIQIRALSVDGDHMTFQYEKAAN